MVVMCYWMSVYRCKWRRVFSVLVVQGLDCFVIEVLFLQFSEYFKSQICILQRSWQLLATMSNFAIFDLIRNYYYSGSVIQRGFSQVLNKVELSGHMFCKKVYLYYLSRTYYNIVNICDYNIQFFTNNCYEKNLFLNYFFQVIYKLGVGVQKHSVYYRLPLLDFYRRVQHIQQLNWLYIFLGKVELVPLFTKTSICTWLILVEWFYVVYERKLNEVFAKRFSILFYFIRLKKNKFLTYFCTYCEYLFYQMQPVVGWFDVSLIGVLLVSYSWVCEVLYIYRQNLLNWRCWFNGNMVHLWHKNSWTRKLFCNLIGSICNHIYLQNFYRRFVSIKKLRILYNRGCVWGMFDYKWNLTDWSINIFKQWNRLYRYVMRFLSYKRTRYAQNYLYSVHPKFIIRTYILYFF